MRGESMLFRPFVAVLAATALAVPVAAGRAEARPPAAPGSAGLGDELFPELGNGGYDVTHYDLSVRYATAEPASPVTGTVRIDAVATRSLSRFDLDFAGDAVGGVTVNGRRARFTRTGEELVVTPAAPLPKGRPFVTEVTGFRATPVVPNGDDPLSAAFFVHPDGSTTAGQPNGIHRVFPSNDHPSDKASFAFHLDVPAGESAVANGVFTGRSTRHGRTTWNYVQRQPMATELTQLSVGDLQVIRRAPAAGVPVRDVIPTRLVPELGPKLASVSAHLPWMVRRVGPYPFDVYGSLPVEVNQGFALETQTLSMYDSVLMVGQENWAYEPIMVHELAHQWFGDSVAPAQWKDVWQNEGHATWYEFEYAEQQGHLAEYLGLEGLDTAEDVYRFLYGRGDLYRSAVGPVASPPGGSIPELFNAQVYYGGALALYALRQKIGDRAFRALERAWVARYENRVASTDDFIRLASQVSHQNLRPFLTDWLYGTTTPPMPGHPDWTVTPVPAQTSAATLSRADRALADHLKLFKH